jgi:hypothetical protein
MAAHELLRELSEKVDPSRTVVLTIDTLAMIDMFFGQVVTSDEVISAWQHASRPLAAG